MSEVLLKARIALELPPINAALDRACEELPAPVRPVARHIFKAGGKRLRPLLVVLFARLLGYTGTDIHDLAIPMEMLHAATLLHDDVLDSATLRRGAPTAHTVFGSSVAILAGDALLASANARIAGFGNPALSLCFSEATSRTCAGEIMELAAQRRVDTTEEEYAAMMLGKTAWLIRASCELGALRAGVDPARIEACACYGENLGMAFQMVDDALDFLPEKLTGKPSCGDMREGKLTPPLRRYRAALVHQERQAFDAAFCSGTLTEEQCATIAARVREAGYDRQTRAAACDYLTTALKALSSLPDAPERDILRQMAEYVRDREK